MRPGIKPVGGGRTQGPQPDGRARLAGLAAAWGQSMYVQAGKALGERKELLRASVGYPVAWTWTAWLDGAAPTAFGVGGKVTVFAMPSLGRGGAFIGLPFELKPGITSAYFATQTGLAATELQLFVESTDVAIGDYAVCAVASPVFWVPEWGPQG